MLRPYEPRPDGIAFAVFPHPDTNVRAIVYKMTLNTDIENHRVRILEITGGREVRRELSRLGIHTGDVVVVKRNAPFGGPLLVEHNGIEVAIGRKIADQILVENVP